MKYFGQRLFDGLAALSLLWSLAFGLLWCIGPINLVRSNHWNHWIYVRVYQGTLYFDAFTTKPQIGEVFGPFRVHGFAGARLDFTTSLSGSNFGVRGGLQMALLVPAGTVLPLLWCVLRYSERRRRRWLQSHGVCLKCGYDLRATPDRCPECGTIPPKMETIPS